MRFLCLDGMMLKDGYLYKKVSVDSLSCWGVMPSEEEIMKFKPSENSESADLEWLSQLYGNDRKRKSINSDKGDGKRDGSSGCSGKGEGSSRGNGKGEGSSRGSGKGKGTLGGKGEGSSGNSGKGEGSSGTSGKGEGSPGCSGKEEGSSGCGGHFYELYDLVCFG